MASNETTGDVHPKQRIEIFALMKHGKDVDKNELLAIYDSWESYDEDVKLLHPDGGPSAMACALAELGTRKDISVLDCGSGSGLVGEVLQAKGFTNISAVDISQKSLIRAEKKGIYNKLVCVDVGQDRMPFDDDEFDAVVCSGSFIPGHIDPVALRELSRIVKPGGVVLITMRRAYVEVIQGEEDLYSKKFLDKFNEVLEDLINTKKMEMLFKKEFPVYAINSPGLIYTIKVL